jgi:hypothetical protein
MPAALAYAAAALERGADDLSLRLLSGLAATGWRHQRGAEFHTEMMQRCGNAGRSLWADGTTLEVVDEQAAPVARLTLPRRPLAIDCNPAGDEVLVLDHELRRYRLTAPASPTVLMVNPEGLDQATDVMVAIDDLLVLERPTGLEVLGRDGARRHRIDLGRTFARVDYAPLVGLIGIGRSGKGYRLFDLRTGAEVADLEVAPIASAIARGRQPRRGRDPDRDDRGVRREGPARAHHRDRRRRVQPVDLRRRSSHRQRRRGRGAGVRRHDRDAPVPPGRVPRDGGGRCGSSRAGCGAAATTAWCATGATTARSWARSTVRAARSASWW